MFNAEMELPAFDFFEYCLIPQNPAIEKARKIINRHSILRIEKEDQDRWGEYRVCVKCLQKKIRKKYLLSEMTPIKRKVKKYGRIITINQFLCPDCIKEYKPRDKRVGGHNF